MLKLRCPECGGKLRVPEEAAGRQGRCPHCGAQVSIPPAGVLMLEGMECERCGATLSVSETIHVHRGHVYCAACFAEVTMEEDAERTPARRRAVEFKTQRILLEDEDARVALRRHAELEADKALGSLLLSQRVVGHEDLLRAQRTVRETGRSLVSVLVSLGLADEKAIGSAVARTTGIPFSTAAVQYVDRGVKELLPLSMMATFEMVPLSRSVDTVTVAMVNPLDEEAGSEIEHMTGLRVHPVICTLSSLRNTLRRYFGAEA